MMLQDHLYQKIIKKVINKLENFDAVLPVNFNDTIGRLKKTNLITKKRNLI